MYSSQIVNYVTKFRYEIYDNQLTRFNFDTNSHQYADINNSFSNVGAKPSAEKAILEKKLNELEADETCWKKRVLKIGNSYN